MNVFTVPPDISFLDALARSIFSGRLPLPGGAALAPHELAQWRLYLPTRRSQAAMEQAFLAASGQSAMLLPRTIALGEIDEFDESAIDPVEGGRRPIAALERRFMLADMIAQWADRFPHNALARIAQTSAARLLSLAESLGSLIDSFAIAEVDLARISELADLEIPGHMEEALEFLRIVQRDYPRRLGELNQIGRYEQQAEALARTARRIETLEPRYPVIAAGSTGSMPATARLLKAIAASPNGMVILPGLDRDMDDAAWDALEPQDAQYGLKELLRHLAVDRADVPDLPGLARSAAGPARIFLLREVSRPAATSEAWSDLLIHADQRLAAGSAGLRTFAAPDQRIEAAAIALILRETLEAPSATAALVTPDRSLAMRVATELRRWNIDIDDSAGLPLSRTPVATLASLVLRAMLPNAETHDLLALLCHPLFAPEPRDRLDRVVAAFEIAILRGPRRANDPQSLRVRIAEARSQAGDPHTHRLVSALSDDDWVEMAAFGALIERTLEPLNRALHAPPARPLGDLVAAHREALAAVTAAADRVWADTAGQRLQSLLDELAEHADGCPPMLGTDYAVFFDEMTRLETVRDIRRAHPRLKILGLLEARLVRSDVTVLAGMNEGVWPALAAPEPWMSRLEKQRLGLQLPERRVGLNAHDFVQNAAGPAVWLTWSAKIGGKPALPSRFVERLQMLTGGKPAAGRRHGLEDGRLHELVAALEEPGPPRPVAAPMPAPAVIARPTVLSVSAVHDLIRDPYGFYARRILRLRRLEPLAADPTAADQGTIVHAVAHRFVTARKQNPTADPLTLYRRVVEQELFSLPGGPAARAVLASRLSRIGPYLVEFDAEASAGAVDTLTEVEGETTINAGAACTVRLTARADRIDVLPHAVRIVDYKTGSLPSAAQTAIAFHPQLLIEALIAEAGGFAAIGPAPVESLRYVKLAGRDLAGEDKQIDDLPEKLGLAADGLARLFAAYADPAQPYNAVIPPPNAYPGDYELLSRWKEWSANLPAPDPGSTDD
jgi:ATP-dependent helicase/nuclease subunit B